MVPSRDVGLGTLYERRALYALLRTWTASRTVSTALEGPVDGIAGMPGLHLLALARNGTQVTVCHPEAAALDQVAQVYRRCGLLHRLEQVQSPVPPRQRSFDLVLSFNALPQRVDWRAYLADLARCARLWLAVVVSNPASYGARLRRLLGRVRPAHRVPLLHHDATRPSLLEPELARLGDVLVSQYVDCPWWPDLFVPTGQTLLSGILGLPAERRSSRWDHDATRFPCALIDDARSGVWGRTLRRHPTFEQSPRRWARLFGHHLAYLVATRPTAGPHNDASPTQRKPAATPAKNTP